MELTASQIGNRLRMARESIGLNQQEVAAALGLERTAISRIESGERGVSGIELTKLAKLYGRPLTYFVEDETETESSLSYLLRTTASEMSAADRQALAEAYGIYRDYAHVERLVLGEAPPGQLTPQYGRARSGRPIEQGTQLADSERHRLDLGQDPIRDIFDLLEHEGIKIVRFAFSQRANIAGCFFLEPDDGPCIAVNASHPLGRQHFTAAHEYCHYLQDQDIRSHTIPEHAPGEMKSAGEKRADAFAAAFLMPEAGIADYLADLGIRKGDQLSPQQVLLLCDYFGASYEAMLWRLKDLGWCNDGSREALSKFQPTQLARSLEVDHRIFQAEPSDKLHLSPRLTHFAVRAYEEAQISFGKLGEVLRQPREQVVELLQSLGVMPEAFDEEDLAEDIANA